MLCKYSEHGLFLGSTPDGNAQVGMCCWQEKKKFTPPFDFSNSYITKLRDIFDKGVVPKECSPYCKITGHGSNEREWSFKDESWTHGEKNKITKLHLEQSLICNLKCISCGPLFSSAWNTEYFHFDNAYPINRLYREPEKVWNNLDLSSLIHLHYTGGEPLLNKDNKKILQHLDKIGRLSEVCLTYNTNGTIFPDQETINLWSKAKWIRLFISLDGVGSTFEYTRYPAKWNDIETNIKKFQNIFDCCIIIEITFTAGIHNLFNLPEFFDWWEKENITGSHGDPSNVFIKQIEPITHGGKCLQLKNLPEKLQQNALDILNRYSHYRGVDSLISEIQNCCFSMDWLDYLNKLDEIRNTNFKTQLPKQLCSF